MPFRPVQILNRVNEYDHGLFVQMPEFFLKTYSGKHKEIKEGYRDRE